MLGSVGVSHSGSATGMNLKTIRCGERREREEERAFGVSWRIHIFPTKMFYEQWGAVKRATNRVSQPSNRRSSFFLRRFAGVRGVSPQNLWNRKVLRVMLYLVVCPSEPTYVMSCNVIYII